MAISIFDLFKVGIGPSSSHTVGPMVAAKKFAESLKTENIITEVSQVSVELFGSLGATGKAHGAPKAIILGLEGEEPHSIDVSKILTRIEKIKQDNQLNILGRHLINYNHDRDLKLFRRKALPFHPNGMVFTAFNSEHEELTKKTYFSVGGGFVVDDKNKNENVIIENKTSLKYPFSTAAELLEYSKDNNLKIADIMFENEKAWRSEKEIKTKILSLWSVMQECIQNGINTNGVLPGGLNVSRRAYGLHQQLIKASKSSKDDPLSVLDWVTLYALAINEENAAGGRIVTAPTNGAAGIIPAVLSYYVNFIPGANDNGIIRYLLTAAAIGILYKKNASISGAEVGCQGEVGSACSMAAGALAEVLGGSSTQIENAAEIAMEHNLGLTCDPVGGLVQIPCIERNAMASIKAIHAARMALKGDGNHFVSLDKVIETMRKTGQDMHLKYKETSRGGLATNVLEVPVNIIEC